ncbi:MAG: MerR family transcriptional regulator [Butyrivibrio sp.]|nr:MerR family transcriptional regulator [Butyrivibrio sp.]
MRMNDEHKACTEKQERVLYKIGFFAQMNHITVKTLRFYESEGLLIPAYVDDESGYRYYTMDQMSVIHQITALKKAGFTLEDIKRIRNGGNQENFIANKKAEVMEKIAELTRQLAILDSYLTKKNATLDNPVLVKTLPEVIVASVETRIDTYDDLFTVMPDMGALMEEAGCVCAKPEYCFTQYLESGYKEEKILIQTCEAVTEMKEDLDQLHFQILPEVEAACIFHKGSYDRFPESYATILQFIEDNGYEITGNIRENYVDGIWNTDSSEQWLSEIQIPVRKRG